MLSKSVRDPVSKELDDVSEDDTWPLHAFAYVHVHICTFTCTCAHTHEQNMNIFKIATWDFDLSFIKIAEWILSCD